MASSPTELAQSPELPWITFAAATERAAAASRGSTQALMSHRHPGIGYRVEATVLVVAWGLSNCQNGMPLKSIGTSPRRATARALLEQVHEPALGRRVRFDVALRMSERTVARQLLDITDGPAGFFDPSRRDRDEGSSARM